MEIRKTKPKLSIEQKVNENLVSSESILNEIKEIYLSEKDMSHFLKKITKLNVENEELEKELQKKNELLKKSTKLKDDFNKKIQDLELDIYRKREKILSELGN